MSDILTPIAPSIPSQDAYVGAISYNRDGQITLPPFWDDAMVQFSGGNVDRYIDGAEFVMRRMMRDPILFSTDRVFRALVCEGEHVIVGAVEEPAQKRGKDAQRYKRSERAREFTQGWVDKLERSLSSLAWHLCEAFAFGNKLCEIEPTLRDGQVVPLDVSPKPRTAYRYVVDKSNRVLGARPYGGVDVEMVPPANLLYLSVGGMDYDPNGGPAVAAAYDSWYRKGNFLRDEVRASAQSGGASLKVNQQYPPAGVPYVATVQVKKTDGTVEDVATSRLAAQEAAKIRTGSVPVFPPGYDAQFMVAGQDNFGPKIDRCDREMVLAFVGATRMTMEAQNGSRADSDTAEGVAQSLRDWARGLLSAAIERVFAIYIALNLGEEYLDVVPKYDIITEESEDLGVIGNFLAANWDKLNLSQKNWLIAKAGGPEFTEEDETAQIEREAQAEQEQENREFAAKFSIADFKSQIEISNEAAQKRVDRTVRTANRQFRSLVTRFYAGKLSEEEFRERFAYTLATGHERAYRNGYKHGGGDELSPEAEEYIATVQASEAEYMIGLAEEIANGTVSEAQALQRAGMYANRMNGTANEAFRQASEGTGLTITWDLNGSVEDHCAECPQYASMSPWEPDEMFAVPRSGDTPCLSNCKCRLIRSDGRAGFAPTSM